ncbi:MAG: glucans biosynthesis glucosyltransferase MdoH [Verrucomicrobia bacterium]|nr:glucans biosynthesis glucosyltransferase MdoH [Verrucomicrobiota bacterium]
MSEVHDNDISVLDVSPIRSLLIRRLVFFSSVVTLTAMGTTIMADILWHQGMLFLEWMLLGLFLVLFANLSFGFCQFVFGFLIHLVRRREVSISDSLKKQPGWVPLPIVQTAIVLPVCDEDVKRVYEGLRAIYRSVERTGEIDHFNFFILSDSRTAKQWVEEEAAWVELCKQLKGFGRIFYRKRRTNINRKSGNISDFCRRWGNSYRYMITLDADSLMSGETLVKLVQLMEINPEVGIVQTAPQLMRAQTLFARIHQFSNRLYGRLFSVGLNFWQMAESNYWGHNAIIRLKPFIEHCALPELPGKEPFGGKILSHDYVEAALMRRGGWQVWLAYDLPGSWEEGPPNLIEFAKRDRRWCQGNLQHSWLLFARGLFAVNRLHLGLGILSYVGSFLWLLFLIVSFLLAYDFHNSGLSHIPTSGFAQFWSPEIVSEPLALFFLTVALLFMPKVLSVLCVVFQRDLAHSYGGRFRVIIGALVETVYSIFQAPILMLFHSKFVVLTFLGKSVGWGAQNREAGDGLGWREAFSVLGAHTLIGILAAGLCWWMDVILFYWMCPLFAGLIFSIPLTVFTSRAKWGDFMVALGLLKTPEEWSAPYELQVLNQYMNTVDTPDRLSDAFAPDRGISSVLIDPYLNGVHVSLLRQKRDGQRKSHAYFESLCHKLLKEGPDVLNPKEQLAVLRDAHSVSALHRQLWLLPSAQLNEWWNHALREYNLHAKKPFSAIT